MSSTNDSASQPSSPDAGRTPFERFEEILRKVVAVPKAEVDKRRHTER